MEKIINIKNNRRVTVLLHQIESIKPSYRTDIVESAFVLALGKETQWKEVHKYSTETLEIEEPEAVERIQLKVGSEDYGKVEKQIINCFDLKRVTGPFLIQLVLTNYLMHLKCSDMPDTKENIALGDTAERYVEEQESTLLADTVELYDLEMIRLLTELLQETKEKSKNKHYAIHINNILNKWKERKN